MKKAKKVYKMKKDKFIKSKELSPSVITVSATDEIITKAHQKISLFVTSEIFKLRKKLVAQIKKDLKGSK